MVYLSCIERNYVCSTSSTDTLSIHKADIVARFNITLPDDVRRQLETEAQQTVRFVYEALREARGQHDKYYSAPVATFILATLFTEYAFIPTKLALRAQRRGEL